jgi:hypothetical protein
LETALFDARPGGVAAVRGVPEPVAGFRGGVVVVVGAGLIVVAFEHTEANVDEGGGFGV